MSRYFQNGHFNGHHFAQNTPLTLDQAIERVPAIGATDHKPGLSAKYGQVHTAEVVKSFINAGYLCIGASQTKSRNTDLRAYAKHVIQFTRPELRGVSLAGETGDIRVVISNSHDGTGAYVGSLGLFRHACTNSLVVSLGLGCFRVRHHLNAPGEVIEATYRVLDNIPLLKDRVTEFSQKQLTSEQRLSFAVRAAELRWTPEERGIDPSQLLKLRRAADASDSLWHVYNRVQENLIKGGLQYWKKPQNHAVENAYPKRFSTRSVTAPVEVVRVNRALWELAEEYAKV